MERSTRLSILEHALEDTVERLRDLPPSADAERLRALARQYAMEVELWREHPPGDEKREALLRSVLDLSVSVVRAGGASQRPPPSDEPDDEDFPRAVEE